MGSPLRVELSDLVSQTSIQNRRIPDSINGGPGRGRTADARIFSPSLYQLSYQAICNGGLCEDRTHDLLYVKQMLSQLS